MKNEDAPLVKCCVGTDRCEGDKCMAWLSNKEGTQGQCIWMVLSNMAIQTISGFMPRMVR